MNKDCLDYIHQNSPLISNSLSFLFDLSKRKDFFYLLTMNSYSPRKSTVSETNPVEIKRADTKQNYFISELDNSLNRFIQLYVPFKHMKHLSMQSKLNMITQFLLTNNKTDESKIELIIDLANHYADKQQWKVNRFKKYNACGISNFTKLKFKIQGIRLY